MFFKFLGGLVRTSVALQRSVTALGAAMVIAIGIHDYMKGRKR